MTKVQAISEARDIMQRVRWNDANGIDLETRKTALQACMGLINRTGDNRLKSLVMRAINENSRNMRCGA